MIYIEIVAICVTAVLMYAFYKKLKGIKFQSQDAEEGSW